VSDGQTETNESIAAQNAVSVRLEPGESVKWHDGRQWRVGTLLMLDDEHMATCLGKVLVQTVAGIYPVDEHRLEPYPPRCERCGGEGLVNQIEPGLPAVKCPECGGSGRKEP